MFFFGASITLSGVYLLSRREMNVLKPVGKFRAAVKMVIFIKRTQKARNIDYRWVQPLTTKTEPVLDAQAIVKPLPSLLGPRAVVLPPLAGVKVSKASVMPIDSNFPPLPAITRSVDKPHESSETTTALDLSSSSQIQITPKRLDK
jgi:hypothetical protein